LVSGDRGCVHSISDPSNCSSDNELGGSAVSFDGCDLNDDAKDHDSTSGNHLRVVSTVHGKVGSK
jgi:hypothetical protein